MTALGATLGNDRPDRTHQSTDCSFFAVHVESGQSEMSSPRSEEEPKRAEIRFSTSAGQPRSEIRNEAEKGIARNPLVTFKLLPDIWASVQPPTVGALVPFLLGQYHFDVEERKQIHQQLQGRIAESLKSILFPGAMANLIQVITADRIKAGYFSMVYSILKNIGSKQFFAFPYLCSTIHNFSK